MGYIIKQGEYEKNVKIPEGEQKINDVLPIIQKEYALLQIFPGGVLVDSATNRIPKLPTVSITSRYTTDKSWDEIENFYREEALRNGWVLNRGNTYKPWDQDRWSRTLVFDKGEYKLYISNLPKDEHVFFVDVGLKYPASKNEASPKQGH